MDGTIYMGNKVFPYTVPFLDLLKKNGIGYSFLTNNPTKSTKDYLKKLSSMGIEVEENNMYSTVSATIDYLKRNMPEVKKLFMLGTESMTGEFEKAGYIQCTDSPDDVPDALIVAFDPTLNYSRLCRAAWWASKKIPYIATNPDKICPTDKQTILVDCGSLQKCIEHATGRKPDVVLGKPDPEMIKGICCSRGLEPNRIAMVGDRIYTDVAMAVNSGALGVLVLSGETTADMAEKHVKANDNVPDIIVQNIMDFGILLEKSIKE